MSFSNEVPTTQARETALAKACNNLAKSLRDIDPVNYYLFFEFGEMTIIYDQITKLIDSHFTLGVMNFTCTGEAILKWNRKPHVAIDLEFFSDSVFVFFRLFIAPGPLRVEIHNIVFQESASNPQTNTLALEKILRSSAL
jgi:hypothetical protein